MSTQTHPNCIIYAYSHMYIYTHIVYIYIHIYPYMYIRIHICMYSIYIKYIFIRQPLPELERVESLVIPQHLQILQTQSTITAIPCNPLFVSLQSTCTAKCTLPHCILSKEAQISAIRHHRLPHGPTGRLTFWPGWLQFS